MDFDFKETYKDYSNTELLKIIHQPGNYVPEAIAAATVLLAGREVLETETAAVQEYLAEKEARDSAPQKQLTTKDVRGFGAWLFNQENTMPAKWFSYFIAITFLFYLWMAYNTIRPIFYYYNSWSQLLNPGVLFLGIYLLFIGIICYLLFNKEKWGWIFLFIDLTYNAVSVLWSIIAMLDFYHFDIAAPFSAIYFVKTIGLLLLKIAMAAFVWSPVIANFFEVPVKMKRRALAAGIIVGVLFKLAFLA
jgi:hypothetical protein